MQAELLLFNAFLVGCGVAVLYLLFTYPWFRGNYWSLIVTPLASIIGSGFLVVAPLLHGIVTGFASLAILGIVVVAYLIGTVIRYNIQRVEPLLEKPATHRLLYVNEQVANLILSLAYLVSVAFYLHLMSSFLLHDFGFEGEVFGNALTTVFLLIILVTGVTRGLKGLELLEKLAVNIKLSIIAVLIVGLLFNDVAWFIGDGDGIPFDRPDSYWQALRQLAGAFLIVQGFETCRYLGDEYKPAMRIKAMRIAQLVAAAIYFVFIVLSLPVLSGFEQEISETAIIAISGNVAYVLPAMLVIAAVMSQASAAIADTVGAGGLVHESTGGRVKPKMAYVALCAIAIVLVWSVNIFQIISIASRLFALYYAIQCLSALLAIPGSDATFRRKAAQMAGTAATGLIMLMIAIFALPASHP
jgi:hypothetical protein